ncbi:MAG TPA: hypothetical protein VJ914_25520 [Pseudonocardiaceae bacterium]|nr:hypothetical protein [Pseudonocardiaceae bacterium]
MATGSDPMIFTAEAAGVGIDGAERPTEDRIVVLDNAVLLLDGATALDQRDHTASWYVDNLAAELATHLHHNPTADLKEALATAITTLATKHDLTPGKAPSSTVALLRWTPETIDALVLADSPIVAFTSNGPDVLLDERIAALPKRPGGYRARLAGGAGFDPGHVEALRTAGARTGRLRNVPGGFWVAEADPAAAHQARTRSWPRPSVHAVLMATDGVSCGIDDYQLLTWPQAFDLAATHGPQAVLDQVRAAERDDPHGKRWPRPKRHDDQALALIRFA